jgi:hypothetical protein
MTPEQQQSLRAKEAQHLSSLASPPPCWPYPEPEAPREHRAEVTLCDVRGETRFLVHPRYTEACSDPCADVTPPDAELPAWIGFLACLCVLIVAAHVAFGWVGSATAGVLAVVAWVRWGGVE